MKRTPSQGQRLAFRLPLHGMAGFPHLNMDALLHLRAAISTFTGTFGKGCPAPRAGGTVMLLGATRPAAGPGPLNTTPRLRASFIGPGSRHEHSNAWGVCFI